MDCKGLMTVDGAYDSNHERYDLKEKFFGKVFSQYETPYELQDMYHLNADPKNNDLFASLDSKSPLLYQS